MFFRKKKVNRKEYWYLVENTRKNGKVKQRVIKYIGDKKKLDEFLKGVPR